jgi:glycosyltransferase involved in cell wall biosynthesis
VPWELLICDNGSQDATIAVVEGFKDRLPLTLVDASAQRGPGAARNTGAERARGRWLAFCDADDVVGHDWLARMCAALERYPFVAGRFEGHLLNDARTLRSRALDQQEGLQLAATGDCLPHAGAGNMGIHRTLFLRVNGFDPTLSYLEDTDLSWRVQKLGVALEYVDDVLVHVRLRSSLVAMFQQGRNYGAAHAELRRRHGGLGQHIGTQVASLVVPSDGRGLRALVEAWVGSEPSLGRLVWQIGWHRGYRRARRANSCDTTHSDLHVGFQTER